MPELFEAAEVEDERRGLMGGGFISDGDDSFQAVSSDKGKDEMSSIEQLRGACRTDKRSQEESADRKS
jgi:hypothetical protein